MVARVHHGNAVNWEPGSVVEKHSPVSMVVKLVKRKCHIHQVQLQKQVPEPVNKELPIVSESFVEETPV